MQDIHFNSPSDASSKAVHSGGVNMGDGSVAPNPGGAQMQDIHFNAQDDDLAKKFGKAPGEFTGGV
jgi:hypothetical protein